MPLKILQPKHDSEYQGLIADAVARYLVPSVDFAPELRLHLPDGMEHDLVLPQFKRPRWLRNRRRSPAFSTAVPHPMYQLSREDLAKGLGLDAAVLVGWRYLVYCEDRCIAASHTSSQDDQHHAVLNRGPFVEGTRAAIELAESLPQVTSAEYEPALLSVPALYVVTLWLRSSSKEVPMIFLPISPRPSLLARPIYAQEAFVSRLVSMAQQQIDAETNQRELL